MILYLSVDTEGWLFFGAVAVMARLHRGQVITRQTSAFDLFFNNYWLCIFCYLN